MKKLSDLRDSLALLYDRFYRLPNRVLFSRWVVKLGVCGFLLHLGLIGLSRQLAQPPAFVAAVGTNYLSAIDTPFSFVLFYEVLILIAAIPRSTARSVANQFEIVSLIFVRGFFKDIADIDDIGNAAHTLADLIPAATDLCASILMFLLVTVFRHVALRWRRAEAGSEQSPALRVFVARKKAIALALTVWLLLLTLYSLAESGWEWYLAICRGAKAGVGGETLFYSDVFSVMIFTDVLILILSLALSNRFELVFRNAAFVISTILIRYSLTAARPYGVSLAIFAMIFGTLTMLIYRYNRGLEIHRPAVMGSA